MTNTFDMAGPPVITTSLQPRFTGKLGEVIRFICPIKGNPEPIFEWYRVSRFLKDDQNHCIISHETKTRTAKESWSTGTAIGLLVKVTLSTFNASSARIKELISVRPSTVLAFTK